MEIDGLAKNILLEAVEKGYMPTLKRWIDEGSHELRDGKQIFQVRQEQAKQGYYTVIMTILWHFDGLKRKIIIKSWYQPD